MAGLAPGALAVVAFAPRPPEPSPLAVQVGALAGGVLLLLAATLLARRPQDEPDRGAHFARAASAGLVAVPALSASWLGLAPGPRVFAVAVVLLLVVALYAASRRRAPVGGFARQLGAALTAFVGGAVAVLLVGGLWAAFAAPEVVPDDARHRAVYDQDATVATVALPSCAPRAERVEVLTSAGAHPRLAAGGETLFFDAPGPSGRRQVHRRHAASGDVHCLTCGEPGNNRHPAPNADGTVVLFDTDRYATWLRPNDTELQLLNVAGAERGVASRRITYFPGPDERPIFAPSVNTLVWSHGEDGGYRVVSSAIVSGHGSLQVGGLATLATGGAAWVAPLGWSPDARTLAVVRGNPLGPGHAEATDPATELAVPLGDTASGSGALSFNRDGGWYALATARRSSAAGLLPDALGFAVAPALAVADGEGPRFHEATDVLWGATGGEPRPVDLGESATWGWPTGIALEDDGTGFVLGQRRATADGIDERLIAVRLDCS
ncbi:MAG TPA: hypothetical protein VKB65_05480 [Myxococcota bacterium]|nr:hypothetical protein [Myxococcota bacterium]